MSYFHLFTHTCLLCSRLGKYRTLGDTLLFPTPLLKTLGTQEKAAHKDRCEQ